MDAALFGEGPEPCIARLDVNYELDEEWTTDLKDATGGRFQRLAGRRRSRHQG